MQILGRPQNKKLQDDVFCLTEERNYFQSKYLEQISEITAMKNELTKAKREIQKLREEVMTASVASMSASGNEQKEEDASTLMTHEEYLEQRQAQVNISISSSELPLLPTQPEIEEEKKEEEEDSEDSEEQHEHDSESVTESSEEDEDDDEEEDERETLRKNAEKLLQWADYRSSFRGSVSSVASPTNSTARSSVGVPRTIQSTSLKEDVEEEMSVQE
ncbi:unnamed protein product [Cylindrotheca closterium]|uniref:Uncharacterized protein n=1 Tax=Cylindrotheca closterium TaxID=2856 RepID=A0AAD2CRU8_9STRA|nr:unnamed protein product [Cylindrotheca closterium]